MICYSFIKLVALVSMVYGTVEAKGDPEAISQCAGKHGRSNAGPGSTFTNDYCRLECYVAGSPYFLHSLNEGLRCPSRESKSFICLDGQCLPKGNFRLTIGSAQLSEEVPAFVTACLFNNTKDKIALPMWDRTKCADCLTTVRASKDWHEDCPHIREQIFTSESTLVLEVWQKPTDSIGNRFVGGTIVELSKLTDHKFGQWILDTPLVGGELNGTLKSELAFQGA